MTLKTGDRVVVRDLVAEHFGSVSQIDRRGTIIGKAFSPGSKLLVVRWDDGEESYIHIDWLSLLPILDRIVEETS